LKRHASDTEEIQYFVQRLAAVPASQLSHLEGRDEEGGEVSEVKKGKKEGNERRGRRMAEEGGKERSQAGGRTEVRNKSEEEHTKG
jgi:hypothetical protein